MTVDSFEDAPGPGEPGEFRRTDWLLRGLRAWERAPLGARLPAVIAWMVSIWLVSSRHGVAGQKSFWMIVLLNGGHFVAFGILALLWRAVLAGRRVESRRADVFAVVITIVYAVADELHQATVPGRSPDPWDVGSDTCGAVFAIAAAALLRSHLSGRRPDRARWLAPLAVLGGACTVVMASL